MIRNLKKLGIFSLSLICILANAASSFSADQSWDQLESRVELPRVEKEFSNNSKYTGDISVLSNQLFGQVGNIQGNRFNADVNFKYADKKGTVDKVVEFSTRYNDAQTTMMSVQNAYLKKNIKAGGKLHEFTVGRHVLKWSPIDANWGFGFLNNRVYFDGFEPGQEGLTGISWQTQFGNNKVHIFGSVLYIPELNPALDIDNETGTITSGNVWAKVPAQTTTAIGGREDSILYTVNMPKISEVVLRGSAGINVARKLTKRIELNGFFMVKPENKLSTDLGLVVDDNINITINPRVFYHNVMGTNITYTNSSYLAHLGLLSTGPYKTAEGDEEIYRYAKFETEKIDETYFSAGFKRSSDRTKYSINYLARISSFDKKVDLLAQNPRWSQAVNLRLERQFNRDFMGMFDVKFDTLTQDRLVMFRTDYRMTNNTLFSLGVNMIGVNDSENSFWKDFKNNDSVYTSLRYRF